MATGEPLPPSGSSPVASEDRLESWKEIANYLNKGVRTVQRWERDEGLPIRRHLHDKLGSVYAHKAEIDAWRADRSSRITDLEGARAFKLKRLVLCGLLAGMTSNALQFVFNRLFLEQQWQSAMEPLGLAQTFRSEVIAALFGLILLGGILSVWIYSMLRPWLGSGPKTAALAGFLFWLLTTLPVIIWGLSMDKAVPSISVVLLATHFAVHLVIDLSSTIVGAWRYEQ